MCQFNDISTVTTLPLSLFNQSPALLPGMDYFTSGDCMMHMKLITKYLAVAGLVLAAALPAHAEKTELNVYTALETDQLKAYQEGFNKAYPDIELKWTRDSTGI